MADPVATPSMIPAVDPQGNLVNIPEEQIPLAQQQGFRPPTADEWAKHLEAVQYGGAGQAAIAGLEGAASGLTFGLAPLAERALGVSPEAMRARKEQNPVAHGVGEAIGVIAPIVATLGAAAPAEAAGQVAGRAAVAGAAKAAAEFSAPSLIAKAGQATAKLAESAGAGRILSSTAGAAVEGGLFGAGSVVEQAAMEDPDLTAEKAISEIGLSAVLGGALGGGVTATAQGLGAVIGKARQGFESMAARVAKGDSETVKFMFEYRHDIAALDEVVPGAAQSIANAPKPVAEFILKNSTRIQKLEESFPGVTDVLSRAEPSTAQVILDNWDKVLKDPARRIAVGEAQGQAIQSAYDTATQALRTANRDLRPAEIERLLGGPPGAPDEYLYHVTPASNEASIAREGLRPDAPKIAEGGPHAGTNAVFLGDEEASQTYRSLYGDETIVYRVRKNRLSDLSEDLYSEGNAWMTGKAIPPHALERQIGDKWVPVLADAAGGEFGRLFDRINQVATQMRSQPELYPSMYPKKLEMVRDAMVRDVGETVTDQASVFKSLNGIKQTIDDLARFGREIPPEHQDAARAIKALRGEIKDSLENTAVWGEAGTRQAEFNAAQNRFLTAKKALEKQLMQKVATRTGAITYEVAPSKVNSWVNLMADARGKTKSSIFDEFVDSARELAKQVEKSGAADGPAVAKVIEDAAAVSADIRQRASVTQLVKTLQGHEIMSSGPAIPIPKDLIAMAGQSAAQHTLGGGITGAVTSTIERVRNPAMMTGVLSSLDKLAMRAQAVIGTKVSALFEAGAAAGAAGTASQVVSARNFERVAGDIQRHSEVNLLSEKVGRETGPMADVAPQHADAFNMLAARALQHLNAKLPKSIGDRRPLDKPYQPSKGEIAKFNRHYTITQNPSAIFEHIARGTLAPEHMETMQVVYPKLLEHTKAQVIEQMSGAIARGKEIPYRTRLMLSLYLGTDLDSTLDVATLQANQAAYINQPAIAPPNTNGGAQSLSLAGRIATPMQSSAERTG